MIITIIHVYLYGTSESKSTQDEVCFQCTAIPAWASHLHFYSRGTVQTEIHRPDHGEPAGLMYTCHTNSQCSIHIHIFFTINTESEHCQGKNQEHIQVYSLHRKGTTLTSQEMYLYCNVFGKSTLKHIHQSCIWILTVCTLWTYVCQTGYIGMC